LKGVMYASLYSTRTQYHSTIQHSKTWITDDLRKRRR